MKKTILFGFVCIAFLLCSCSGDLKKNISFVNSTTSEISVTECSVEGDYTLPLSIQSGRTRSMEVHGASESVSFKVTFSDQNYSVSTGYVQDSSDISVVFTSGDDGGLTATINAGNSSNAATVSQIQE